MTKKYIYIIIASLLVLVNSSCSSSNEENLLISQERQIESSIATFKKQYPDAELIRTEQASKLIINPGSDKTANNKSRISFNYAIYTLGSIDAQHFVASNIRNINKQYGRDISEEQEEEVTLDLSSNNIINGLKSCLVSSHEGEESIIFIPSKYAFKDKINLNINSNSALIYFIFVNKIDN